MPEITATAYVALFSEALVQQLADTAAFQTLVTAANAAAAKGSIIEDAGGDVAETAKASDGTSINCATENFAVVRVGDAVRTDRGALLSFGWGIPAEIDLIIRPTTGESEPSAFRRAKNTGGAIAAQMEALFGAAATRIVWGTISPGAPIKADPIKALRGAYVVRLTIATRDIP
jgi:hypothetical protein